MMVVVNWSGWRKCIFVGYAIGSLFLILFEFVLKIKEVSDDQLRLCFFVRSRFVPARPNHHSALLQLLRTAPVFSIVTRSFTTTSTTFKPNKPSIMSAKA